MKGFKHWCINGCGKKVIFNSKWVGYTCMVCKKNFTKEELKNG